MGGSMMTIRSRPAVEPPVQRVRLAPQALEARPVQRELRVPREPPAQREWVQPAPRAQPVQQVLQVVRLERQVPLGPPALLV